MRTHTNGQPIHGKALNTTHQENENLSQEILPHSSEWLILQKGKKIRSLKN